MIVNLVAEGAIAEGISVNEVTALGQISRTLKLIGDLRSHIAEMLRHIVDLGAIAEVVATLVSPIL